MKQYVVTVEVTKYEEFVIDADDATMAAYQAELRASGPYVGNVRATQVDELEDSV